VGEEFNNVFVFATALYHWIFSSGLEKKCSKVYKEIYLCPRNLPLYSCHKRYSKHWRWTSSNCWKKNVFPVIKKIVLAIFYKNGLVLLVVNIEVKTMEQILCGFIHSH